ncbi:cobyrinate a,c-diamide synthase [Desulfotomaculum copahuensis]|uniref:Cobyrinate a,c-diamide synthase n=1 Tax=Desulfotomaculum copahuensis TaxID=1838280 RepID=A0A1B7LBI7_9FIRM|nr:cobyrinate a,c-diamide synthase [Desulfotomaculum copahuensis]OAT79828.1 cobyrinic acid a,c-diamide synthase [Desulfotomaculum copahuensis]
MPHRSLHMPRLVIGAPQGRSGKTTVTMGLLAALAGARGLCVQPFKKGPDFIDPGWLTRVTGRACRNLDSFLMTREIIRQSFVRHMDGAALGVVEGAMGLYDGVDLAGSGSTAEIAKAIQAPVVLVVDTTRMTRSVAAMVMGFMHFDPEIRLAGVILNKVARPRHENMLRAAIEQYCGLPVLGAVPKGARLTIPDRHLGLIPAGEREELGRAVEEIGRTAPEYLDLDGLLRVAGEAPPLAADRAAAQTAENFDGSRSAAGIRPVIGVFKDRAFSFYYPDNLEALAAAGAELKYIDAINDPVLPEVDALYIGGGFPEVFARELAANRGLRAALRTRVEEGLPVYAECGGLIYLGRRVTWREEVFEMCGALPFDVVMSDRPQGHGYEVVEVAEPNIVFQPGEVVKGHEFHHSRLANLDREKVRFAFRVVRGWGIDGRCDGLIYKNVLATYNHIHALAVPRWAPRLVGAAREHRWPGL